MKIAIKDIQMIRTALSDKAQTEVVELAESIEDLGLSHPIIVRPTNIPTSPYALVSGEKRVLAFEYLGRTEIEADVRGITDLEGRILRLHENIKRTNLPWYELAILVESLHKLRQDEHGGQTTQGAPKKEEGKKWGVRETAAELGRALGATAEDIQLARAVRANPALRNVADRRTAVRLVRKEVQRQESEIEALDPSRDIINQTFCGDSETVLKHLDSASIDHCITDPPWIKFFEPSLRLDKRTLPVFKEVYRVLKHNAFMLVFCGLDDLTYYCGYDIPNDKGEITHHKGELEKIGFSISKTPSIWRKMKSLSRRGVKGWEYDRDFEFVIIAVKGSPLMTASTIVSGIKECDVVPVSNLIHPNEKPIKLIEDYIKDISYEGNLILDPFGGSFVTAAACKGLKRKFVVIERDPVTYGKGRKRLGLED